MGICSLLRLIVLALVIGLVAASPRASAADPSLSTDEGVEKALYDLFAPEVRTFDRDVYVYHWTNQAALGLDPDKHINNDPKPEGAKKYLLDRLKQKETRRGDTGNAGYGFYAAVDPLATVNYGYRFGSRQMPAVIEVVLKKGTSFLDQRIGDSSIPPALRTALRDRGCNAPQLLNGLMTQPGDSGNCQKFVKKIIDKFNIHAVAYPYNGSAYYACFKRDLRGVAFVLYNPATADGEWRVLTPNKPKNGEADDLAEARTRSYETLQKGSQDPKAVSWMREHLYACGAYPEDYASESNAMAALSAANEMIDRTLTSSDNPLEGFGELSKSMKEKIKVFRKTQEEDVQRELKETLRTNLLSTSLDQFWTCPNPKSEAAKQACPSCAERDATNGSSRVAAIFDSCHIDMKAEQLVFAQEPLRSLLERIDATLDQIPVTNTRYAQRLARQLAELLVQVPGDLGRRMAGAIWKTAIDRASQRSVRVADWYAELLDALRPEFERRHKAAEWMETARFVRAALAATTKNEAERRWIAEAPMSELISVRQPKADNGNLKLGFDRVRASSACLEAIKDWKKDRKELSEDALTAWLRKEDKCDFLR